MAAPNGNLTTKGMACRPLRRLRRPHDPHFWEWPTTGAAIDRRVHGHREGMSQWESCAACLPASGGRSGHQVRWTSIVAPGAVLVRRVRRGSLGGPVVMATGSPPVAMGVCGIPAPFRGHLAQA